MWVFWTDVNHLLGYEAPNLRLSWYYGNMLYFLLYVTVYHRVNFSLKFSACDGPKSLT